MGLSISSEGIRAPGLQIDHNGLKIPGLTIDHNGITTPILTLDHNGFKTRELNLFPTQSQNIDYMKPLLIGTGFVAGASLTYYLLTSRSKGRRHRSYSRGDSNLCSD
jgi:hypothetical protein